MTLLDTVQSRTAAVAQVELEMKALSFAMDSCPLYKNALQKIYDERDELHKTLNSLHEWTFNFEGGGWNTVFAYTKEAAIEIAKEKYADSPGLVPNPNTFTLATPELISALMMNFD